MYRVFDSFQLASPNVNGNSNIRSRNILPNGRYRTRTPGENAEKKILSESSGAEYGALASDLRRLIQVWSGLPQDVRQCIMAMAEAMSVSLEDLRLKRQRSCRGTFNASLA